MKKISRELVINAWETIVSALKDTEADKKEEISLYANLLERLPWVTLVLEESRDKGSLIQGVIHFYSFKEGRCLSNQQKKNRILAFRFKVSGHALIDKGWYGKGRIFFGSWAGAMKFIVSRMYRSTKRKSLSDNQQKAFRELIKQFKSGVKEEGA